MALIVYTVAITTENTGIHMKYCCTITTNHVVGTEAVSTLIDRIIMINAQAQHCVDEDTWPPDLPKDYTPLVLICHQEQRTKEQDCEMAKLIQTGDIDSVASGRLAHIQCKLGNHKVLQHVLNTSIVTKEIAEIITPLEKNDSQKFVIIEGAPGIGKTALLKYIAFQWAKKLYLSSFTIVLLVCLRDPNIWQVTSLFDLLKLFCKGDTKESAAGIATACSHYILSNGGKDITFLFDGYDEFPDNLKKNSLIADILNRKTLPLCGLIMSSRPHASVNLRKRAAIRVEILGFTEQERQCYIEQSVKGNPRQMKELTKYLQQHPDISNICFTPLNMAILLFLYQLQIPLPENSAQFCHHFICQTICRHFIKSGHSLKNTITDLTTLPEPYNKILKQLGKLSLEALNNNKFVFTSEDIEAACPDIVATQKAINGFGLLQAVQHFGLTGKTMTFNFLHLTIQEYLAAHYIITNLQQGEELHLLQKHFWNDLHANMFAIYVTLTMGQRWTFKKFLSDGDDKIAIASKFLSDQLKCIRLFCCFHEAGDETMCELIEEAAVFDNKEIDLRGTSLSPTDLERLSLFLTSCSHRKQWVRLNLQRCYIQDHGLHIIHRYLNQSDVTISRLWLNYNSLTRSSSSFISDIVLSCKIEDLSIYGNHTIGESPKLYTMLTDPCSKLAILYMIDITLSSFAAEMLFTAVKDSNSLKCLYINHNIITDDAVTQIATALATNKSLETLWMYGNPISGEGILTILKALGISSTLQWLSVPWYHSATKEMIKLIVQEINTKRKNQRVEDKLTVNYG